jgi:hypothetical protein
MHWHPNPLHLVVTIGPFTKWVFDFMDYNPASVEVDHHIIMTVDYFTKWEEAMPTIKYDGNTISLFVFKQIVSQFEISRDIFTDHENGFQNEMMKELKSKLGFKHSHSSPYYP